MSGIVSTTGPNDEGEMLWCVHFKSSYYDNDPRMPGTVPVDERIYVLAKSQSEAIKKAEPGLGKVRDRVGAKAEVEIEATIVTLEGLSPSRNSSNDGRMGYISMSPLSSVELSHPDDQKRYRLGVCLIPVE